MTPYLIGGITGLLGVVAALWWRYKLAKADGEVARLKLIVSNREKDISDQKNLIDTLTASNAGLMKQHEEELERYDTVMGNMTQREEQLRDLLKTCNDPHTVAARVGQLFPVNKDGDGGEAGHQGGK